MLMSHAADIHLRNKVVVAIAISDTACVGVFSTVVLYFVVNMNIVIDVIALCV